ncbi:MAG: ABC transporter ATP-binding protein [Stappiaceae bacterium]
MSEALLELAGLSKSFGGLRATDGVDLTVCRGEIHALIGPNGAGKSTLIHQIAGSLRPDDGKVLLFGNDATGLGVPARARLGLGRTFQVSSLAMEFSALRNVMIAVQGRSRRNYHFLGNVGSDRAMVTEAEKHLDRVGLHGRESIPASDLSHGERRKLELAVALALKPRLLLLDEPMAGLGAEGSLEMTALLESLKEKAGILLVEHDMDAVFALADRISVLVYGRIIATGSVADIRADPAVQQAYLGDEDA